MGEPIEPEVVPQTTDPVVSLPVLQRFVVRFAVRFLVPFWLVGKLLDIGTDRMWPDTPIAGVVAYWLAGLVALVSYRPPRRLMITGLACWFALGLGGGVVWSLQQLSPSDASTASGRGDIRAVAKQSRQNQRENAALRTQLQASQDSLRMTQAEIAERNRPWQLNDTQRQSLEAVLNSAGPHTFTLWTLRNRDGLSCARQLETIFRESGWLLVNGLQFLPADVIGGDGVWCSSLRPDAGTLADSIVSALSDTNGAPKRAVDGWPAVDDAEIAIIVEERPR